MSPRRRAARSWTVAAITAAAVLAVVGPWLVSAVGGVTQPRLEVRVDGVPEAIYVRDVGIGETFRLEHTHSVTRRLVIETFSVQDASTIAIEELWFDEFGANLPTGPERIGEDTTTFLEEEGAYRVLHHGRAIGTLPLIVGSPEVDHVVLFEDGERLRLLDLSRPGSRVELSVGSGR